VHLNGGFIVTNPGNSSRKLEIPSAIATLKKPSIWNDHSIRSINHITPPGTLDGGDVLISPPLNSIFVGLSARTNDAGFEQFSSIARTKGYNVVGVPISKVLHLKSALTGLPDGQLIGWLDGLDSESLKVLPNVISMPEEQGAHVVVIDDKTLLLSSSAPRSAALLEDLGYRVVVVEISEFEKLDGCVTCLSVRVRKEHHFTNNFTS
jgi:dimethylargininase